MTTNNATRSKSSKPKGNVETVAAADETAERQHKRAILASRPSMNAAVVMSEYAKPFGEQDVSSLAEVLATAIHDIHGGDMKRAESMLFAQANALQSIFMNLALRASSQEYLKQWEGYLRMALKAQNQCRMTLETLANIKNPPVVIARQANITTGPQQVNNGSLRTITRAGARAEENETEQSKLLEGKNEQWVDSGTPRTTIGADRDVETVAEGHRAGDRRG